MIYCSQLFHFYQPAKQLHAVLERISDESLRLLLRVFRQYLEAKVMVNINLFYGDMTDATDVNCIDLPIAPSGRLSYERRVSCSNSK